MSKFHLNQDAVTSPTTAHLGYARRSGAKEWKVLNTNGQLLATIRMPYPKRPDTFRCDPASDVCYADAVEAVGFSIVLDYALNNFVIEHYFSGV